MSRYHSTKARESAQAEIRRLVDVLGECTDLSYTDYRSLIDRLSDLKYYLQKEEEASHRQVSNDIPETQEGFTQEF